MNEYNLKSATEEEKKRFLNDITENDRLILVYGILIFAIFLPSTLITIFLAIATLIWKTKILLFLTIVFLILSIVVYRFSLSSIEGHFIGWKKNGEKFE